MSPRACCQPDYSRGRCIKCGNPMAAFSPQQHDLRGWCMNKNCEMYKEKPGNEGGQLWINDWKPKPMPPMPSASSLPKAKFE